MTLKSILYVILGISVVLAFLLYVSYRLLERRQASPTSPQWGTRLAWERVRQKKWREQLNYTYQRVYVLLTRIPLIRRYARKVRRRISSIHAYDELTMRRETVHIVLLTLVILMVTFGLLMVMKQSLTSLILILLSVLIMNNMIVDMLVHRVENRLLRQFVHLLGDVRHYYHAHGMVEEAIMDASENTTHEAGQHGRRIYDILTSAEAEVELEQYYEVAPNRFLKGFAGISYLILEYGDKVLQSGSLYLNALTKLTQEVQMELLRREKLSYLLRSLTLIAVAPVLFTEPIERWARNQFTAMGPFYDSKLGVTMKALVYITILVSYILLRKIQENDEGKYARVKRKTTWEKRIYNLRFVRTVVDSFVPKVMTKSYARIRLLLKDGNSPLPIEWFTLHRILYALGTGLTALLLCSYLHHVGANQILQVSSEAGMLLGKTSVVEQQKMEERIRVEREIIQQSLHKTEDVREYVAQSLTRSPLKYRSETEWKDHINVILNKITRLQQEYLKWWEVLLSMIVGWLGYYLPVFMLWFQKRLRAMDMKNEVDQFLTMIGILSEMERISVENIVEWLERFASLFKEPLQICLLHYEAGAEQALEDLKEQVTYVPFVRVIEKLLLAVDKIPVRDAFDDLESEQAYYREQRKEEAERILDAKSGWGQMIGFMPLYALTFLYLVFPLVYTSMNQMQNYYEQIQKLN